MNGGKRIVTIFGSSRPREGDALYALAEELGALVAKEGFTLCNGGYAGIMEASARGARTAGGRTIGVLCTRFGSTPNRYIGETILCGTLLERLEKLIELGDAYVVLRGSTGTLLEFAAVWEMVNKSIVPKKPIVLVGEFWEGVRRTLHDEFLFEGKETASALVTTVPDPRACARLLKSVLG